MLSVTFKLYADCHYAECRYAECRGAVLYIAIVVNHDLCGFIEHTQNKIFFI
jgi:hypothetical protein